MPRQFVFTHIWEDLREECRKRMRTKDIRHQLAVGVDQLQRFSFTRNRYKDDSTRPCDARGGRGRHHSNEEPLSAARQQVGGVDRGLRRL